MIATLDADLVTLSPEAVLEGGAPMDGAVHVTPTLSSRVVRTEDEDPLLPEVLRVLGERRVRQLHLELRGRSLPDSLGALRNLDALHIEGPQLAGLPSCIGDLRALRSLRVEAFHLLSLPRSIESLSDLEALHVDSHHFARWPKRLEALISLRALGWVLRDHYYPKDWEKHFFFQARFEPPLDEIFEGLSRLPRLETLYLSESRPMFWYEPTNPVGERRLAVLPEALLRFPALRTLWLDGCGEVELPGLMGEHPTLEALRLRRSTVVSPGGLEGKLKGWGGEGRRARGISRRAGVPWGSLDVLGRSPLARDACSY